MDTYEGSRSSHSKATATSNVSDAGNAGLVPKFYWRPIPPRSCGVGVELLPQPRPRRHIPGPSYLVAPPVTFTNINFRSGGDT